MPIRKKYLLLLIHTCGISYTILYSCYFVYLQQYSSVSDQTASVLTVHCVSANKFPSPFLYAYLGNLLSGRILETFRNTNSSLLVKKKKKIFNTLKHLPQTMKHGTSSRKGWRDFFSPILFLPFPPSFPLVPPPVIFVEQARVSSAQSSLPIIYSGFMP